jgi:hypothetical protein
MTASPKPFGYRLYEELKQQGTHSLITGGMSYADIQILKAADREGVVKMFRGSGYALVQRLKQENPEEVARLLIAEAQRAQSTAMVGMAVMFMGILIT